MDFYGSGKITSPESYRRQFSRDRRPTFEQHAKRDARRFRAIFNRVIFAGDHCVDPAARDTVPAATKPLRDCAYRAAAEEWGKHHIPRV